MENEGATAGGHGGTGEHEGPVASAPAPVAEGRPRSPGSGPGIGTFQIISAFIMAGSSVPAGKLLSSALPPFTAAFLSLAGAMVCLCPVIWMRRAELKALGKGGTLSVALQALSGMVLFRIFLFSGLRLTSSLHAGVITALGPLAMAAASALFLRERLRLPVALGLGLAVSGLIMMRILPGDTVPAVGTTSGLGLATSSLGLGSLGLGSLGLGSLGLGSLGLGSLGLGSLSLDSLGGDALVAAAVLCEAAMSIIRKRSPQRISSSLNAALIVFASAAMTLPFAAAETFAGGFPALGPRDFVVIGYYGAGATALAYLFWSAGSAKASGSGVALAMVAMPLSALLLSVLILREIPGPGVMAGAALALWGMALGQAGIRSKGPSRRPA